MSEIDLVQLSPRTLAALADGVDDDGAAWKIVQHLAAHPECHDPCLMLHSSTNQTWKIVKIYVYIR